MMDDQSANDDSSDDNSSIGLAAFISKVKEELLSIPPSETNVPTHFIESIDLEIQVTVKKEGNAGFKLTVPLFAGIGTEVGGRLGRDNTQKITVKLTPLYSKEQMLELYQKLHTKEGLTIREATMNANVKSGERSQY